MLDQTKFGPWALVTGASSGIGKEFARQLAAAGIHLVLVARRLSLLEELGKQLKKDFGIEYKTIGADLSDENALDKIQEITNHLNIGLVVSNAGTGHPGEFINIPQSKFLEMIQVSVITHLRIAHYFGNRFAKQKRGGILLVGAMGAANGLPFMANDAATRAYIRSLGLGLHEEFKRYGVHVTVLIPAPTDTPIVEHLGFRPDKMPMKPMPVEKCVAEALAALNANRSTILPGRIYRIMEAILPASVSRNMAGKMLAEGNGIRLKIQ